MVVTSTLMPGLSASNRFTASCWYWLRPDSVCWLSQNFRVTVSAAEAVVARPARPARTVVASNVFLIIVLPWVVMKRLCFLLDVGLPLTRLGPALLRLFVRQRHSDA